MGELAERWSVRPLVAFINLLARLDRQKKRAIVMAVDAILCVVAVWIAFSLRVGRWDLFSAGIERLALAAMASWFCVAWPSGTYRAIFRAAGSGTMVNLAVAISLMTLPMIVVFMLVGVIGVPRTLAIMQPMIFFLLLVLSRIVARYLLVDILNQRNFAGEQRRTLIYGAGSAGQQLASSIRLEPSVTLCGFVDDDPRLHGHRINRLAISNARHLGDLITRYQITDVLLALPTIGRARRKRIVEGLQQFAVHVRTLPAVRELVDGRVSVSHLREIEVEDLLGRDPVSPNPQLLESTVAGKVVMVTGAGGSIGGELCRQIIRLGPTHLILTDMSEYGLYAIEQELRGLIGAAEQVAVVIPELVNVADGEAIMRVMERRRPDTVFHAAAYKHVPLVEANVVSGTRNNVFGTLRTAVAADRVGVRNFVLISTDKAVRPTNVMGATKRVCELVLQALAANGSRTIFSMVRFGNVLGSSGSVVPLFKRQIENGGPVTVTDRRITRFFMTIPEASQLVIQSGGMAEGGEVYVLDMGSPVKIIDFAESMIKLSGMSVRDECNPNGDIEIVEVGLRPGEKLYEELLIGNDPQPTVHQRIMKAREGLLPLHDLQRALDKLDEILSRGDAAAVVGMLQQLVPEYQSESVHDQDPDRRANLTLAFGSTRAHILEYEKPAMPNTRQETRQ